MDPGAYFGGGEGATNQCHDLFSVAHQCFFHPHISDNRVTSLEKASSLLPRCYSLKGKNWLRGKGDWHAPINAEVVLANITPNKKLDAGRLYSPLTAMAPATV